MTRRRSPVVSSLACIVGFAAVAAAQTGFALVGYGPDPAVRDAAIDAGWMRADLGARGVLVVDASARQSLLAWGATVVPFARPTAPDVVVALSARPGTAPDPRGVRVLVDDGDVVLGACPSSAVDALRRPGVLDGGVRVLDLDTPYSPAPFVGPRGVDVPDPRIVALLAQISQANLSSTIASLSNLFTRRATQPENVQAATWLQTQLAAIPGVSVSVETFGGSYGPNVIAELRGAEWPDEIVMVGAHFDSYVRGSRSRAPGADDNASGTASVLELVRVFAALPTRRTLRFGFWNAEEYGLIGSDAHARAARARGDRIVAYLNTDMNAYRAANDGFDLDFVTNDSTPSLIATLTQISQTYLPSLAVRSGSLSGGTSDHRSFFRQGYPAVFYFEDLDHYSPFIHSPQDLPGTSTNDMVLATSITRSVAAGMAELAEPLAAPAFALDVQSGPAVGGTAVVATGVDLHSVTEVRVGGVTVTFTPRPAGGIAFETPCSAVAGAVDVEMDNPAGTGRASFTFVVTAPALRMPASLGLGGSGEGAVGGAPAAQALTVLSFVSGGTDVLSLFRLDVGGGSLANVFVLEAGPLSSSGGTRTFPIHVPPDPALSGQSIHFQAVEVGSPPSFTFTPTNVATLLVR